jgi:hypothetical protein
MDSFKLDSVSTDPTLGQLHNSSVQNKEPKLEYELSLGIDLSFFIS